MEQSQSLNQFNNMKNSTVLMILILVSIVSLFLNYGVLNELFSRFCAILFGCAYFIVKELENKRQ